MTIVDTHSHIYQPEFEVDRTRMMEAAEKEGVSKIYLPAIDAGTHERMLALEEQYPGRCLAMMGLHPCSVKADYTEELRLIREYLDKRKFAAIGETGLDFYWDKTFTEQQYAAFHQQVRWAMEFDVPVVIHSRNSTDECIQVIKEHQRGTLKGVFHCFSGTAAQAKQVMDLGFFLGIGGVVTFKNGGLDKVMTEVGLSQVVLETDAPYLAPVPYRGKRNEPAYLKYVVEKLSALLELPIETVAKQTTENAERLFGG